jgi:transglycosylase-like protein with SLT domain
LENAETRFAAAQTIRAVQSGFCVFLGKAFVHRTTFGIPHHALWPRLQGKLNREWRVYRETSPIWQFKGRRRPVAVNRSKRSNIAVLPPLAGRINLTNMCPAGSFSAEVGDDHIMARAIACCVLALTALLLRPALALDRETMAGDRAALDALIEQHANANGLPVGLVRRVIRRESNFNPRAVYRGNYGLMQIRLGTARALGYRGDAEGLLDPATNMSYAVPYLAGAYRAANGDEARTIALYSSGYYHVRGATWAAPTWAAPASEASVAPSSEPASTLPVLELFAKLKHCILSSTSCVSSPSASSPSASSPSVPSPSVPSSGVASPSVASPSVPSSSVPSSSVPSPGVQSQ